ncbi:MAG: WYL domain-containing protein [Chitinispirillaceae bacterium]|nr:WYL domain-containing protein [Chitinispirillaceae bacterium]
MDKWEKVVTLHRLLRQSRYAVTLTTILDELDCSEATFHRIRNFMRSYLGAPVEYDRAHTGYCYTPSEDGPYELPGFWLTKNEIEALLSLDAAVENIHEGFFSELLGSVRKRFEPLLTAQSTTLDTLRERIRIIPIAGRECSPEIFRTVASAVVRKRRIAISHHTIDVKEPLQRDISPQALVRYRDNWYVDAWCHLREELRTFALSRIEAAKYTRLKYRRVPKKELETFFAASYGIFTGPADKTAVIDFCGNAAREVSRENWHPRQKGEWISETTFRLTIPYGHHRELVMDILRWGEDAEVVGPPDLRETVKTTIEKMEKKYE